MAEQNLLGIVQEFCRRRGLPIPAAVTAATDDTTQQMLGLLNEGIQDLVDRYFYQAIVQSISFNHAGGADYLALNLGASYPDFKAIVRKTFWDKTSRIAVWGPATAQQWQQMLTMSTQPAQYTYRLFQNSIFIYPQPAVLSSILFGFEYLSRYGIWDPVGSVATETYINDQCYPRIPSTVVLADLKWRWERDRGFPYAEDMRACEEMVTNLVGREPGQDLDLAGPDCDSEVGPGLYVAAGSWPL